MKFVGISYINNPFFDSDGTEGYSASTLVNCTSVEKISYEVMSDTHSPGATIINLNGLNCNCCKR